MRRDDTTTVEYQRSFRGQHSAGHGVYSYPRLGRKVIPGTDYLRCACGWRVVEVRRTAGGRLAARRLHVAHQDEMTAVVP
jgi:hypothetical protein